MMPSASAIHPERPACRKASSILIAPWRYKRLALALPDVLGLRQSDVVLSIVPMFHVDAWGLPFAAAMLGIKLVLPGPCLDAPSICELFRCEGVTFSAGVPTIWMGMIFT